MDTYFASPHRTERRKFSRQLESIGQSPVITALLKSMSGLFIVVNEDRQIVAMNHEFLKAQGIESPEEVLGLRLGESLKCVHAAEMPAGCGTTPYCVSCGAAIAMMTAIDRNQPDEQVCALATRSEGKSRDIALHVRTQPMEVDQERWILVFAQDITEQQFLHNLERVFFHDVNNILSGLMGTAELLALNMPDNPRIQQVRKAAQRLGREVLLQNMLSTGSDHRHLLQKRPCTLSEIKNELHLFITGHKAVQDRHIKETWPEHDITVNTDIMLVSKTLANMLINALEATGPGGHVLLDTRTTPTHVIWTVWNQCHIPDAIRKRVFQRYFSTKSGTGRGLGTYSMKLFGETYLNGSIDVESSPESGTTFTFQLPCS